MAMAMAMAMGDGDGSNNQCEFIIVESLISDCVVRIKKRNTAYVDAGVDSSFFDDSHSIEASTGSLVWEGSYALLYYFNTIVNHVNNDVHDDYMSCLFSHMKSRPLIELGSGTGLSGLGGAAAGLHVLMTDLQTVVDNMLYPHIMDNMNQTSDVAAACVSPWRGAQSIGVHGGSAAAMALDWCDETLPQHGNSLYSADMVIAADTVWLKSLIGPFVNVTVKLLHGMQDRMNKETCSDVVIKGGKCSEHEIGKKALCVLAFKSRAKEDSTVFAQTYELLDTFRMRGCHVESVKNGAHSSPANLVEFYVITLS